MRKLILPVLLFLVPLSMSVWDLDQKIAANFPFVAPYVWLVPLVTAIVIVLLIATALFELFAQWYEIYLRLSPSILENIAVSKCRADNLRHVVDIASKKIGPATTDFEKTKILYEHNSSALWAIRDTLSDTIIGYFCVLPLTLKGENRVKERDLMRGEIDLSNFARRFRKGMPVYIGGVAALNQKAAAAALEHVKAFLLRVDATKAYARPMTDDGVRLVKRHGFKPVARHDQIREGVYVCRIRQL